MTGTNFGGAVGLYTNDSTTLVSTTPTTGTAGGTTSPITATVNVSSGGAVLACVSNSGATVTGYTTPNDPNVVQQNFPAARPSRMNQLSWLKDSLCRPAG